MALRKVLILSGAPCYEQENRRWLGSMRGAGIAATIVAVMAALAPASAPAQITVDGTLSPARSLAGPNYAIGANLGRQLGANLFQSFGLFNVNTGESATFSGPTSVGNIIARVTGGSVSSINGTIASTIPSANLFLINPAGLVFGPNAQLQVSGAFPLPFSRISRPASTDMKK